MDTNRLSRKLMHLRLRPIRVFLFHQISDAYDSALCNKCDWTQIDVFKSKILKLKENYVFLSLSQATEHLKKDVFRTKGYAVLTNDDGSASLKNILPWLKEQGIPVTLFVNAKYLDGASFRNKPSERYLTWEELFALDYDGIEIAHHGWEHDDLTMLTIEQVEDSISKSIIVLEQHSRYIPFWAYTWGRHTPLIDSIVVLKGLTPVLIDGMKNYKDTTMIHRELIDG